MITAQLLIHLSFFFLFIFSDFNAAPDDIPSANSDVRLHVLHSAICIWGLWSLDSLLLSGVLLVYSD